MKSAVIGTGAEARFLDLLKDAQKELQELRRTNRQLNARIKRSNAAIEKNLEESQKNIDYVKAAR